MQFKLPKSSKKYKTEKAYLKSVFYRNRAKIVEVFGKKKTLEKFIANVESQKKNFQITSETIVGTKQALRHLAETESFTPAVDRFRSNLLKGLRKFKKVKEFQYLMRDKRGRFVKIEEDRFWYDKESRSYQYDPGGDYLITITVSSSPYTIELGTIPKEQGWRPY